MHLHLRAPTVVARSSGTVWKRVARSTVVRTAPQAGGVSGITIAHSPLSLQRALLPGDRLPRSSSSASRPDRAHEVSLPQRSSIEHGRLRTHEGQGFSLHDPDVGVRRLLPHERGDRAGNPSNVDFQHVVHRLPWRARDRKAVPPTVILSLTRRGFGVAAMSETLGGRASGRTFFSNTMIIPLARSVGGSMCSSSTFSSPWSFV